MRNASEDTIGCRFFAPLEQAYRAASSARSCPEFPDEEFLESGVGRVMSTVRSGREWVQQLQMRVSSGLSVGNFFQALKSPRRMRLSKEVDATVCAQVDGTVEPAQDPLSEHPELKGFEVYASDGHYEEHATHMKFIGGKNQPVGFFYSANLRTHSISLLDIARPKVKREHDMTALKRLDVDELRMGHGKGVKVLHVYDPAGIDFEQWRKWKQRGIYILTRQKENMNPEKMGDNAWDREDPRNTGVQADELIASCDGTLLRRVTYHDPQSGNPYIFITNEMTIPPGLIAFLYKLRWDVEKIFDQKKNKLDERKAWGCSEHARVQQALFICMAHNLMLLLERCLEKEEGLRDEKVEKKRAKRLEQAREQAEASGMGPLSPLQSNRATQRSLQFIRWLRHCLFHPTPYEEGAALLKPYMAAYIC